jgi:hypothetical protein
VSERKDTLCECRDTNKDRTLCIRTRVDCNLGCIVCEVEGIIVNKTTEYEIGEACSMNGKKRNA